MPYSLYLTGLGYRADKVDDMTGSWRNLTNPSAEGRSFMLDDFQEGIGMANLVNGYDLNASDPEQLAEASDYLVGIKPNLRGYSSDTITQMASGNAWIQQLWNGDIINARIPGQRPEHAQVPAEHRGRAGRQRRVRDPRQRPASGHGAAVHRLHARALGARTRPGPATRCRRRARRRRTASWSRTSRELQVTVEDLETGQQFANLEGQQREDWDRVWTEVKAA